MTTGVLTWHQSGQTLDAFEKAHAAVIQNLCKRLAQEMPFIEVVQFTVAAGTEEGGRPVLTMPVGRSDRTAVGRNSTPVMARLDPKDIETLDALITAGIVSNRAEGIRWTLARIRERPHVRPAPRAHRQDQRDQGPVLKNGFIPVVDADLSPFRHTQDAAALWPARAKESGSPLLSSRSPVGFPQGLAPDVQ